MKDWVNLLDSLLFFIPTLMGTLSYLSFLREKDSHLKNLTEFWVSIGVYSLLIFIFRESMDEKAAIPMLSWPWIVRTQRLVLEDISGQKIFKRGHYITIGVGAFLSFALAGYGASFLNFTLPFSLAIGGIGLWAAYYSFKKTPRENLTCLHVSSYILFCLFSLKTIFFPVWRINPNLLFFGIFSDIIFLVGFSGTGLSTYLEFIKTNHKRTMDKFLKERSERIQIQSRYFEFGLLFGGLSHEINNPLTVIKAKAIMLQRNLEQTDKKDDIKKSLEQIISSVDKINHILISAKEYLSPSGDDIKAEVSLKVLFEEILSFYGQRLKNHGINIRMYGVENKKIYCFKTEIEQVILNLLSNSLDAIEFLSDKWIEISVIEKPGSMSIQFVDSGSGIPDEIVSRMMEPFYSTKENRGTGMGLYSARETMRKHGGDLTYIPNKKHTTFLIELPKTYLQEWDMVLH
jgi:signal transduction histidine kinase